MAQDRERTRRRRRRRRDGGGQEPRVAGPGKRRWRETIDSFGGFLTIGAVGGAVLVVLLLVLRNPLSSASDDPLLGEAAPLPPGRERAHTDNPGDLVGRPGEPPAGGPHFAQPWPTGVFDEPVPDGNAIHSVEHGIVWITYNPDLIDEAALATLEDVADDFRRDLILAPRPQNSMAVAAVSWGRILKMDVVDGELLRDFIRTNRNRSPEPGIR